MSYPRCDKLAAMFEAQRVCYRSRVSETGCSRSEMAAQNCSALAQYVREHAPEVEDVLLILDFTSVVFRVAEYGEAHELLRTLHDRVLASREMRVFIAELIDAALSDELWATLFIAHAPPS